MVLIVTLGQQCSIMSGHVFLCTVHLLKTTTKLRSDAFAQATGDFDSNLCMPLSYCRGSCCGSSWCTVYLKLDISSPSLGDAQKV